MELSIIIPVYNEESLVIQVLETLSTIKWPSFVSRWEVVLVDDCSTDDSYTNIQHWIADKSGYSIHKHQKNSGKGAAVRSGIAICTGDTILIQDADLELQPADIPALLQAMEQLGVEMVNGSRYLPGPVRPLSSYKRYIANKLFSWLTSFLIDIRITDMACGYKLMRRTLLEKLDLRENRFAIEAELLIKAARLKRNNIAEVPVQYFPRNEGEGKKFRTTDGIRILWKIVYFSFGGR